MGRGGGSSLLSNSLSSFGCGSPPGYMDTSIVSTFSWKSSDLFLHYAFLWSNPSHLHNFRYINVSTLLCMLLHSVWTTCYSHIWYGLPFSLSFFFTETTSIIFPAFVYFHFDINVSLFFILFYFNLFYSIRYYVLF